MPAPRDCSTSFEGNSQATYRLVIRSTYTLVKTKRSTEFRWQSCRLLIAQARLPRMRGTTPNSCSSWLAANDNSSRIAMKPPQRTAIDRAAAFGPRHDNLVADIVEDFTPIIDHGEGKQTKGAIKKAMNGDSAEPLGKPRCSSYMDKKNEAA